MSKYQTTHTSITSADIFSVSFQVVSRFSIALEAPLGSWKQPSRVNSPQLGVGWGVLSMVVGVVGAGVVGATVFGAAEIWAGVAEVYVSSKQSSRRIEAAGGVCEGKGRVFS